MREKLSFSNYAAIGVMLFALFFGAGNLIFPAQLGQLAGANVWQAVIGFLITGVGLPLLGILAMSFSGSKNLQDLAGRIHPIYGVMFTALLYLTIGPFFAAPRTGTVAFDVGISPFISEGFQQGGLMIFTLVFFAITLFFSLYPAKIVDYVGKILAPGIVVLLVILLAMVIFKPMGSLQTPQEAYADGAFLNGFLEGYNTMDALASLVFGIIVIKAIRSLGITSKREILRATARSGSVAIVLLGAIYVGIAYLGATSTEIYGIFDNGGPVLSSASTHYFGTFGLILLALVITLACLTTSIGLTTACSEYFHSLFPRISYKKFVVFFAVITFVIANFGLTNIITYSIPVLMFLYPLAIVLMLLAFLSPLFYHGRSVYISVIAVTFLISSIDGLKSLCESLGIPYFNWMIPIVSFYETVLPLYNEGLGWLIPACIVLIITGIVLRLQKASTVQA
ncbi:MAG: branched-chain amino acid transport system II carrier protein [Bacillota bacterium]|uniref:Branched-chain amino acid transport system carrier protein n=1 Tax=Virgibacillus salarius TaxID=447199 RepID=A0A941DTL3_9BACI|nr:MULTISPECIES: branched-chain amino acid transport system II carrier protein [Bacillaceae]NAZ09199.1 branched-chain amino acid transport system II carrier protein [Agaribacter marinus]MBR7796490.1 branched-chain amino acid transport system II carrier protein [Virgibacillus salarius]MCC2249522.1 branched-chain amino acid transport system II carrier protein [Virgibacillus sp. AGTR]MDY7046636.1 branched-chain amino acid transport system II carrier protein [Virgibacillus sp. M23]QRZ19398.1 branc